MSISSNLFFEGGCGEQDRPLKLFFVQLLKLVGEIWRRLLTEGFLDCFVNGQHLLAAIPVLGQLKCQAWRRRQRILCVPT